MEPTLVVTLSLTLFTRTRSFKTKVICHSFHSSMLSRVAYSITASFQISPNYLLPTLNNFLTQMCSQIINKTIRNPHEIEERCGKFTLTNSKICNITCFDFWKTEGWGWILALSESNLYIYEAKCKRQRIFLLLLSITCFDA